jgi:hypothetical protein
MNLDVMNATRPASAADTRTRKDYRQNINVFRRICSKSASTADVKDNSRDFTGPFAQPNAATGRQYLQFRAMSRHGGTR